MIHFKAITEKGIIFIVNGTECTVAMNTKSMQVFLNEYNQTSFQKGETIYNINSIDKFIFNLQQETKLPLYLNDIPYLRSDTIFGRENDIENIKVKLFAQKQLLLVNAIGGVGKTTAAIYYVEKYQSEYLHIIWVNGEQHLQDFLLTDSSLLVTLGIDEQVRALIETKDRTTAWAVVQNKLKVLEKPVLWVIDNAEKETRKQIRQLQNTFLGHHFLITSRGTEKEIPTYVLDNLSESAAVDLFFYHCERLDRDEANILSVKNLIEKVLHHALTVTLLAKTLQNEMHLNLADFATEITEKHIVYLEKKTEIEADNYEEQYIYSILEYVFDLAKITNHHEALHFLEQASVFPSQNLQYRHLKELLVNDDFMVQNLNMALNTLVEKGWINLTDKQKLVYTYHPVVQEVVRKKQTIRYEKIKDTLHKIELILHDNNTKEWWKNIPLLPYSTNLLNNIDQDDPNLISLQSETGAIYEQQGNYNNALIFFNRTLSLLKKHNISNPKLLVRSYNNIGSIHHSNGFYKKALSFFQKGLNLSRKHLSYNNFETSISLNNTGFAYHALGDYLKAKKYYISALNIRKKLLPDDINLAISYNNVGFIYNIEGNYNIALKYFIKSAKIYHKLGYKKHTALAVTYNNIGLCYRTFNEIDKSLLYYQKALKIQEEILGKEHPHTAATYNNLGLINKLKKNYVDALLFYEKTLNIYLKTLKGNHPYIATIYHNMAYVYIETNEYTKSLQYFKKAISIREDQLGINHTQTAMTYEGIGKLHFLLSDMEKSLHFHLKSLNILKNTLSPEHPTLNRIKKECAEIISTNQQLLSADSISCYNLLIEELF